MLEQLDITYDCSIGFPYDAGFRSGIAFPYYLYNFNTEMKSDIIEIPLLLQESALRRYLMSGINEAMDRISELFDRVKQYHGCISVIWHNDYFDNATHPGYPQLYTDAIKYIYQNNGIGFSCKDLVNLILTR